MRVELSFLRSKLGHRIFWLFVVCALLPISLLAFVTWLNVTKQLREQSHRQLAQLSREEAMTVFERLRFLEDSLKLLAAELDLHTTATGGSADISVLPPNLAQRFTGVQLLLPGAKSHVVSGKTPWQIEFTADQEKFLNAGKSVVFPVSCQQTTPCILLGRRLHPADPSLGTLVAEMSTSYLWGEDELPADANVCILDASGGTLFCSGQAPPSFPLEVSKSRSGEFEWNSGRTAFLAEYWSLPLSGTFCTSHWTVVASEPSPDALMPLVHFRTSLILVFLLTVWIVLLLSLIQIRRNLIPLGKLQEGTRGISQGNFKQRVVIESGDEFQDLAGSFNTMASRIDKQLNSLKTFNEIDRAILSEWETDKIVDTVSSRLGDLIPLETVAISLFDQEDSSLAYCYVYERGRAALHPKQKFSPTEEDLLELHDRPEVCVFGPSEPLPSYVQPLSARAMKFFLRVPILLDDSPAAVICLGHSSASLWNDEDRQTVRQLADQVGVALTNLRLVRKLDQLHWGALSALARAIDAKSPWTMGHSERVTELAIRVAQEMRLPAHELEVIRRGGLVHDVGKIGVPAKILNKAGKLTGDELRQMREHVNIGVRILQPIREFAESMSLVAQHHEWINGQGYPNGLKGDQISLHARILAVADCFDALVSDRPYRTGIPLPTVIRMISDGAGTQFDPQIVEVFRRVVMQENVPRERKDARPVFQVS